MKIKFKSAVAHSGKIHPKDSVHDVGTKDAHLLIEKGLADAHVAEQQQQQQQQAPVRTDEQLLSEFAGLGKPELGKVLATAKAVKTGEANYAEAQAAIRIVTELLKK